MRLIVISSPDIVPEEIRIWCEMFEAGLQTLHLRKPDMTLNEVDGLLRQVPDKYRQKIVIHKHDALVAKYSLKGSHHSLNELKDVKKQENRLISSSFHVGDDPESVKGADYVFLSPAFDSISKKGYKGKLAQLETYALKIKIPSIALGGITTSNITELSDSFDGAAILGFLWQNPEKAVKRLEELIKLINS